jgi:DNA-binding GntR family transcriptional regulator
MKASEKAYLTLFDEIVAGKIQPGTILGEVDHSSRLGISRTPFREALHRLHAEGFVTAPTGRGVTVTAVSAQAAENLYCIRRSLEDLAVRLAVKNGNPKTFEPLRHQFQRASSELTLDEHSVSSYYKLNAALDEAIDCATKNEYLVAAQRTLRMHASRVRRFAQSDLNRLKASAVETELICEAIVLGNAEFAAHATQIHLFRSLEHVRKTFALKKLKEEPQ